MSDMMCAVLKSCDPCWIIVRLLHTSLLKCKSNYCKPCYTEIYQSRFLPDLVFKIIFFCHALDENQNHLRPAYANRIAVNTLWKPQLCFKDHFCIAVSDCTLEGMHWHYQRGYKLNKNLLSTRGILKVIVTIGIYSCDLLDITMHRILYVLLPRHQGKLNIFAYQIYII